MSRNADLERVTAENTMKNRLDHCLTCGAYTANARHHLHHPEDQALHRLATAKAKQREAEWTIAYWRGIADEIESDSALMEQVAAALANLTPFGKTVAARNFPAHIGRTGGE